MEQLQEKLIHHLQEFDLFNGFESEDLQEIIHLFHSAKVGANASVYRAGDRSEDIFILLQGHLVVVTPKGETLNSVICGECVGEAEVFTGDRRVANVVASVPSSGVFLRKSDIDDLMSTHSDTYLKFVRNIYRILSTRLAHTNQLIDEHTAQVPAETSESDPDASRKTPQDTPA